MPITLDKPGVNSPEGPQRTRFTRDQYHFLFDNGLLSEDRRYELAEGDVLEKMGQKEPHIGLIMRWVFALARVMGQSFVRCQAPIALTDYSEPEPDVVVTTDPAEVYIHSGNTPTAKEARLVIEVSVSSLKYDLEIKSRMYARAGIPEYWVSDVEGRRLIVHRNPTADGYASVVSLSEGESVSLLSAPHAVFVVADFLP